MYIAGSPGCIVELGSRQSMPDAVPALVPPPLALSCTVQPDSYAWCTMGRPEVASWTGPLPGFFLVANDGSMARWLDETRLHGILDATMYATSDTDKHVCCVDACVHQRTMS